jgi:hypothetical protein
LNFHVSVLERNVFKLANELLEAAKGLGNQLRKKKHIKWLKPIKLLPNLDNFTKNIYNNR